MSAVLSHPAATQTDVNLRLAFQKQLQLVTNKIHATSNIDEIMLEVSSDICQLFNADRLTIYSLGEEGVNELAQTLSIAFKQRQKPQLVKTKYDYLISDAVLSAGEFELASRQARKKAIDIEAVLTDEFQVKLPAIGGALSKFFGVPYEPFKQDRVKPMDLLKNLKREYVESNLWLPIDEAKEGLSVLCLDPERIRSSRIASNVFPKSKLIYKVTTQKEFKESVNQFYGQEASDGGGDVADMLAGLGEEELAEGAAGDGSTADEVSAAADNELVKLVNKIIIDAYNQGVSDIHVEPYPGKAKTEIRFRRDGNLQAYIEVPASYRNALAARLKIMCDLDISEKRKPQDGKIKFKKFGPLDIELRVATIPTQGGVEDVVMRILAAGEPIPLEKMGFSTYNLDELQKAVNKPYGLFFVCGPTGSGKTTTLHSVLKYLNTPDTKIWTAEDPVEITQKGLRQVQVNKKAGLDFAAELEAFLL